MTKQTHTANPADDRPALLANCSFQRSKGFQNSRVEVIQHRKKGLSLEGLSFAKAYLDGDLRICVLFESIARLDRVNFAACLNREGADDTATTLETDVFEGDTVLGWQKDHVLVGNVEDMEAEQVFTFPTRVRLNFIEDDLDDLRAGSATRFGMSLDGTFKVLPRPLLGEGEFDVPIDCAAIGFDQNAVRVIEGGPEVVQRITENRRRMAGQFCPNDSIFPRLTIVLGNNSLSAITAVAPGNLFQVRDVVFGPFGL